MPAFTPVFTLTLIIDCFQVFIFPSSVVSLVSNFCWFDRKYIIHLAQYTTTIAKLSPIAIEPPTGFQLSFRNEKNKTVTMKPDVPPDA
jgi:hypothetical protein